MRVPRMQSQPPNMQRRRMCQHSWRAGIERWVVRKGPRESSWGGCGLGLGDLEGQGSWLKGLSEPQGLKRGMEQLRRKQGFSMCLAWPHRMHPASPDPQGWREIDLPGGSFLYTALSHPYTAMHARKLTHAHTHKCTCSPTGAEPLPPSSSGLRGPRLSSRGRAWTPAEALWEAPEDALLVDCNLSPAGGVPEFPQGRSGKCPRMLSWWVAACVQQGTLLGSLRAALGSTGGCSGGLQPSPLFPTTWKDRALGAGLNCGHPGWNCPCLLLPPALGLQNHLCLRAVVTWVCGLLCDPRASAPSVSVSVCSNVTTLQRCGSQSPRKHPHHPAAEAKGGCGGPTWTCTSLRRREALPGSWPLPSGKSA